MAQGIKTAISIVDGLTPALKTMTSSLDRVIYTFDQLHKTAEKPFDITVNQAINSQLNLNNAAENGIGIFQKLKNTILGVVGAYAGFQGVKSMFAMSDTVTNINSRLDLMKDEFNTVDSLQAKIMQSANSTYSSYKDMADMVGKLGNLAPEAFGNNDDIILFSEQINKLFTIAGTSSEGKAAAMLQLTQALASGVLRGEEFNSVLENAPTIAAAISKALGVNVGELRKMAAEGKLTADVVKNSIYKMADETNRKFDQMDVTYSDLWNLFKNNATKAFMPLFNYLRDITRSEKFRNFVASAGRSLSILAKIITGTFSAIGKIAQFIKASWKPLAPVLFAVLAPLLAYKAALVAVWTWQKIIALSTAIWKGIQFAIATAQVILWSFTNAQRAATAATFLFNSAWLSNPAVWILLTIIAVIAAVVGAVYAMSDSWQDAFGTIAGGLTAFGAFIANIFGGIWNIIAKVVEFFVNVWSNPIYSVKKLFGSFALMFLNGCISMTEGWDRFATAIANAFIAAINHVKHMWNGLVDLLPDFVTGALGMDYATDITKSVSITSDLKDMGKGIKKLIGKKPKDLWEAPKFEGFDLSDSFKAGKKWGAGMADKISKFFKSDELEKAFTLDPKTGTNGISGNVSDIAGNTKTIADNTKKYEEDLRYMRDIAEREAINRFTTAEIKIGMTNNNNISSDMDINSVIDTLTSKLYEGMSIAAEGNHA